MNPQEETLKDSVQELFAFWIIERTRILHNREQGLPKPWTDDPILKNYRFCNVRREDDTVTKFVRSWMLPWANHQNLLLGAAIARFTNVPNTIAQIGFPDIWSAPDVLEKLEAMDAANQKIWTSAYIVSTNGHAMPKAKYVVQTVLDPLAKACKQGQWPRTLAALHARLTQFNGVGSFMSGQIIADLKNTTGSPWSTVNDEWMDFVVPGPGSRRGLARLIGRPAPYTLSDKEFYNHFALARRIAYSTHKHGVPILCAQDVQNCLCEFDKYMRVKLNEGRPRQTYTG